MARVPLLMPDAIDEDHRAFIANLAATGGLINLYRAMAHSPVALRRFYDLLVCLWGGSVGARHREIAILSVVTASRAPYPLGWHIDDAMQAGLTHDEVQAIVTGRADEGLPPGDADVARLARELTTDSDVSDATYAAVTSVLDDQQVVELVLFAGLYRLVACIANALEVDLDDQPQRALKSMGLQAQADYR